MLVLWPSSAGAVERAASSATPSAVRSSLDAPSADGAQLARKRRAPKKQQKRAKSPPPEAPAPEPVVEEPAPAPAPPPAPGLALVPLRVDGLQLNDVARLNEALREHVARVAPQALQPEARTTELYEAAKGLGLACDINQVDCALQLGALLEVPYIVLGRANGVGATEAGVDLRLVDVAAGREARRATVLLTLADGSPPDVGALVEALFSERALTRDAIVSLRPSSARLFVDGMPVPVAPQQSLQKLVGLLPGPHVVRAEADGYQPKEQRFEAKADTVSALEIALAPLAEITVEREISPLEIALPWTVAGAGLVVAAAGAITAVIGAQPWLAYSAALDEHAGLDATADGYPALAAASWQEVNSAAGEWETWGMPAFTTGASLAAVGVVACAVGATWGALLLLREPGAVVEE